MGVTSEWQSILVANFQDAEVGKNLQKLGTDTPKPLEWQGANLLELSFTSKAELDIFDA